MPLSTKLKELRARSRESLQQVADAVGVSKAHIWELERGTSKNPGLDLLKKLQRLRLHGEVQCARGGGRT